MKYLPVTPVCHQEEKALAFLLVVSLTLFYFSSTWAAMYWIDPDRSNPVAAAILLVIVALPTACFLHRAMDITARMSLYPGTLPQTANLLTELWGQYLIIGIGGFIGGALFRSLALPASVGCLLGISVIAIVTNLPLPRKKDYSTRTLRGRRLISRPEAFQRMLCHIKQHEPLVAWAGLPYPDRLCTTHFCITGSTGSGKTVLMRLLMQTVLPFIKADTQMRALIYDAKQDIMEILSGMPICCDIKIMNPLDKRSYAWDMARDVTSVFIAIQVASVLIPQEKGDNRFFSEAARDLFSAVMIAYHYTRPLEWTFADVLLTLSDSQETEMFLKSCKQTRRIAKKYYSLTDAKVVSNIEITVGVSVALFTPIAALWSKSTNKISLKDWVDEESILVLGNDDSLRAPLDAINRVLFQRITELILAKPNSESRKTWFFLDELKEASRLPNLDRLMTKGRSKGCRAVLAWQAIEGLREVYGNNIADEIAGMCANKAFLRTDSHETAKWNSQVIGEIEVSQWTRGHQSGGESMNEQIIKKELILPSQFMDMDRAGEDGFEGYFITPETGVYYDKIPFAHALCDLGSESNFIPRDDEDQLLESDDTEEELMEEEECSLDDITEMSFNDCTDFDDFDDD